MSVHAAGLTARTYTVPLSLANLTYHRPPQSRSFSSAEPPCDPPVKLKLKILPIVSIASPPFPQAAYGRKVEQVADIIVPIGGKVDITLDINIAGLLGDNEDEQEIWGPGSGEGSDRTSDKKELAREIKATVERMFEAVRVDQTSLR